MARLKSAGTLIAFAALALAATAGWNLRAQGPAAPAHADRAPEHAAYGSIQEALVKPFPFRFQKPTPLDEVARQLARSLKGPVIVDRAALDRLGLKMNDEVQLELEGVRLKTGLKLLLDQLDLTYRVVAEDNLLVITDAAGAADPCDQVPAQLKALHRDLHDVQDAVDDIHEAMGLGGAEGAKLRKPTIIEEMPHPGVGADGHDHDHLKDKPLPKDQPPPSGVPRSRPGA